METANTTQLPTQLEAVPEKISFPQLEEKVLETWKSHDTFKRSLEHTKDKPRYTFYDGPPFATGLPHYGHLLAGTIKDIIPRFWTMRGHYVDRRFGWDCHGLPVEYEIDTALKLGTKKDREAFGVAKYNAACREIVLRYTSEWEKTVTRMGRWVDFERDYKTMDRSFMESVWWVFKQLWDQGLVYEGFKVLPYSTGVATPLSNFEASLNYKEVQDPAITVVFPLLDEPNTSFLAWTTTPWTLPSNLALCVGPEIAYAEVKDKKTGKHYIMAEARLAAYHKSPDEYEVIRTCTGADLAGKRYVPLFPYFEKMAAEGAFRVITGDFVTTEDGTGIVHTAPGFGEEDFRVCAQAGIQTVCPIDDDGCFSAEVADYAGRYVKEADKDIIKAIKDKGRLLLHNTINHNYPYCWRSDTPLIYRAISTWFVKVEAIKDKLLANNAQTNWVPENLRDGRFGNWLANARDWAISRNRFWGNPLPVWRSEDGSELRCFGSIAELEQACGKTFADIHREHVDDVVITDKNGKPMHRVPEVLDCWFESGSMPYAQQHYPFENKNIEDFFPADFIAEGLDQTRGWFYTLTVIASGVFDKPAFKNVVVNGLVLASDGKKMSKRLKNYPDPTEVINAHGADALRLYLINSPVVRAEEMRFQEEGVKEVVRKVFLPFWNAYKFFATYAKIDEFRPSGELHSSNILDQWVLSRLQTLIAKVTKEMEAYRLYNVVPALLSFLEELTNTYIRLNRRRFWETGLSDDKRAAYETLYAVLFESTKLLAPFVPFIADEIYGNLRRIAGQDLPESVHLASFPAVQENLIKPALEDGVARMEQVIEMGRSLRVKHQVKVKIPLKELKILHRSQAILDKLEPLEGYIREELNVVRISYQTEEEQFVKFYAKPNAKLLGPKYGRELGKVGTTIAALYPEQLLALEAGSTVEHSGYSFSPDDVLIYRESRGSDNIASNRFISIVLDLTVDEEQRKQGLARELVSAIQKLRKEAGYQVEDRIGLHIVASSDIRTVVDEYRDYLSRETLAVALEFGQGSGDIEKTVEIQDETVWIALTKS